MSKQSEERLRKHARAFEFEKRVKEITPHQPPGGKRIFILGDLDRGDAETVADIGGVIKGGYIPAKDCLDEKAITTHKKLLAFLNKNPEIRTQKPSAQRLEVHAADFIRAKQKQADAQWSAADADIVAQAIEDRKANIRRDKTPKAIAGLTALAKKISAQTPR